MTTWVLRAWFLSNLSMSRISGLSSTQVGEGGRFAVLRRQAAEKTAQEVQLKQLEPQDRSAEILGQTFVHLEDIRINRCTSESELKCKTQATDLPTSFGRAQSSSSRQSICSVMQYVYLQRCLTHRNFECFNNHNYCRNRYSGIMDQQDCKQYTFDSALPKQPALAHAATFLLGLLQVFRDRLVFFSLFSWCFALFLKRQLSLLANTACMSLMLSLHRVCH